jgi:hypothetical protein
MRRRAASPSRRPSRNGKNKLDNYAVQAFQQVDYRSKDEIVQDVFTKTSIDALHNTSLQSNPYVMRGLQGIIPGRRSNVEVTPAIAGGTKVSMSIAAARKELKGQRKNPPEVPSLEDHTSPSIFSVTLEIVRIAMGLAALPLILTRSLLLL